MKDKLLQQTEHEYSPKQRFIALMFLAPIFLIALPYGLMALGSRIDRWMQWPPIPSEPINLILGWLLILPGWLLAMWSIYAQFTLGRGTPVPLMATQKLIIQPPFNYCRNPMSLGSILMYLGVAVLFRSLGAAIIVLLFAGCLLTYIKRVEEREMETRFGQEYLEYRQNTPFLLPRLRRRS
ncbi:MAG: isoprenylcysteine carboxylmethyltransferase family protein [Anaerolineales bacterium]|nr:isoprenylcysteine carboxylmethyltransferase family protein [Anaerolineales bacterium]